MNFETLRGTDQGVPVQYLPVSTTHALVGALLGGGLAENVAETLGKKVTDISPGQGFAASLVTAILLSTANFHSVPVGTTHVSVGPLLGIGMVTKQAKWRKVGEILLAWIFTVPCGAIAGAVALSTVHHHSPIISDSLFQVGPATAAEVVDSSQHFQTQGLFDLPSLPGIGHILLAFVRGQRQSGKIALKEILLRPGD